ncbi:hypothetical protein AAC387_Pa10g0984 [Persea americana]
MTLHTLPSGIRPNSLPLLHPNALSCSPSQRRRCIFTREVFLPSWCMLFCCEIPSGADEFCLLFSKCDSVTSTQQMAADSFEEFSLTPTLSLPHAWEAVRSRILQPPWAPLVWSNSVNPKLSWRLLHRKSPTVAWAQSIGVHLAGSCPSCFKHNESDCSIFFYGGSFSPGIWKDLLSISGSGILDPPE